MLPLLRWGRIMHTHTIYITYVGFLDVINLKGKPLIHIESISGIHDAMVRAIEELAEMVSDEWE